MASDTISVPQLDVCHLRGLADDLKADGMPHASALVDKAADVIDSLHFRADSADERVRAAHIAGMREAMDIVDNGDHTSEEGCALWERIVELEASGGGESSSSDK